MITTDNECIGNRQTKFFCIPGCKHIPPVKQIERFSQASAALFAGYRPCEICNPELVLHSPRDDVKQALLIDSGHIHDWQLREHSIHPDSIRRWFKSNYGFSFQTYQRIIRMNTQFENMPRAYSGQKNETAIYLQHFSSPLGTMYAAATDQGLCLLEFTERRMLEREFDDLRKRLKGEFINNTNVHINQAQKELEKYYDQKRKLFSVTLHTPGTDFQQRVWKALLEIPLGKTISYQGLAEVLGLPHAQRAVARAVGSNRVAIILPCHRVIGKDGSLTGYAGGLKRKRWLLDHEQAF